ncbi:indole-3-glycerol phosphate synthase TrpC [Desulfotomaculum copahuensis]|nr:indole-3-glycerol phosphate synthase TrpC [Desulfotomaculum copahuensis]
MILDRIIAQKKREVARRRELRPVGELEKVLAGLPPARPFKPALRQPGRVALLAEIKRASPSRGWLCPGLRPAALARLYEQAGAAALSVLTDNYFFRGHAAFLPLIKRRVRLPVLRKDFIIDPYQLYESRCLGADAVLLIAAALSPEQMPALFRLAGGLGLACLVEAHTGEEVQRALDAGAEIIGINNRDLRTFHTDLSTTCRLRELITAPSVVVVSESGIATRRDVLALAACGVDAALVGEALVTASDVTGRIGELFGAADGRTQLLPSGQAAEEHAEDHGNAEGQDNQIQDGVKEIGEAGQDE